MLTISFEFEERIWKVSQDTGLNNLVLRFDEDKDRLDARAQKLEEQRLESIPTRIQPLRQCQIKDHLINRDVLVFWPKFEKWYPGTVTCQLPPENPKGTHLVRYWDDNNEYAEKLVPSSKGLVERYLILDQ